MKYEFLNKRWQDLTQGEKEYFLKHSTISTARIKTEDGSYQHALQYEKEDLLIACLADEDNNITIRDTARIRSRAEIENYSN